MVVYIPCQGDIVDVDFNPTKGHEQRGKRPAMVISNAAYYKYTGLLIVCPISNTESAFPMHIPLEDGMFTKGSVLTQHIRTIDPQARPVVFREAAPESLARKVIHAVGLYIR